MLLNIFQGIRDSLKKYRYAKMFSGATPVFSQFGEDVYASDIVKNCIKIKASEMSKLRPRHIREESADKQVSVSGAINRLLTYGPNQLMTTAEFLEKCVWLREIYSNCFIYPMYVIKDNKRVYTGFYPLKPKRVDFLSDEKSTLFIKMWFTNGENYTLPYADVIHWRKDYALNDFMGGDENGQTDNSQILKVLRVHNTLIEGMDKAVKSSLCINGILKVNTMLEEDGQEAERNKFENKLKKGESGIIAMDLKSDYIPINRSTPVIIDKDTIQFIESKIINNYGVSFPILTGDFTDEQYQAFYEKTLEADINTLGQAFTKVLFSDRELDVGNVVIFYPQKLLFTNTKNKIAVADILGNRGALTDNQLLELFGYPPFEGGDMRHMSLNFINRDIADGYQMSKFEVSKGVKEDG